MRGASIQQTTLLSVPIEPGVNWLWCYLDQLAPAPLEQTPMISRADAIARCSNRSASASGRVAATRHQARAAHLATHLSVLIVRIDERLNTEIQVRTYVEFKKR
jgi:hypothetical protein